MCAADASAASSDDYRESVGFSNEMHQCRDSLGSRTCDDAIKKKQQIDEIREHRRRRGTDGGKCWNYGNWIRVIYQIRTLKRF